MAELIEVNVLSYTDPTVVVDVLPAAIGTSVMSELKGPGAGNTNVLINDPKVVANPHILDYRNVVQVKVGGVVTESFLIQKKSTAIIDDDASKEVYAVSGETLRTWFNDAIVYPEGGLRLGSFESRFFNFATVDRSGWYVSGSWVAPTNVVAWGDVSGSPWRYAPSQWPDVPLAQWIWSSSGYSQALGDNFFRYEFTAAAKAKYSFFFAADDTFDAYIDGQLVSSSSDDSVAWSTVTQVDATLDIGSHVFAVRVTNKVAAGPAALLASILVYGDPAAPTSATLVSYTGKSGDTNWKVNAYPSSAPGWSPGEIILKLMGEATARGVRFPGWLHPTFTGTADSNGTTWPRSLDWSFDTGSSMSAVVSQLEELVCDLWIDPSNYNLNMVIKRGTDRTVFGFDVDGITVIRPQLVFEKGKNLLSSGIDGVAHITNTLMLATSDGFDSAQDTSGSVSTYGAIEAKLDTGIGITASQAVAAVVFTERATPEEGATYAVVDIPGYTPKKDYDLGDLVWAPDGLGAPDQRRVMSISVEPDDAGNAKWAVEFDTIFQDNQTELSQWLTKMGGGSLGGSFANSGGGSSIPVGVPTIPPSGDPIIKLPVPPTSLAASSVGLWASNGVDAYSEVTLTWNAVTTNTDGSATVPFVYEVSGHLTANGDNTYEVFGTTSGTTLTVRPFITSSQWTFRVRAFNSINAAGAYSSTVNHTMVAPSTPMAAPSTPTLTSSKGVLLVAWDGLLAGATTPPPQFRYVYASVSTSSGGTYTRTSTTLARDGRTLQITGLTVGTAYWVKLTAVDGLNIASAASAAATATVTGVDLGDLTTTVTDAISAAAQASIQATGLIDNSFEINPITDWLLLTSNATTGTANPRTGTRAIQLKASTAAYVAVRYNHLINVDEGDAFYLSGWIRALGAGATASDGVALAIEYGVTSGTMTGYFEVDTSISGLAATYQLMSGSWTAPTGTRFMRPVLKVLETGNTNNYVVDDLYLKRQAGNELLEDAAVSAAKLAAASVTAGALAASSVTATAIAASAVVAGKIAAGAVTANEIAANTITANNIAAGTITTANLSSAVGGQLDISSNNQVAIIVGQINAVNADLDGTQANLASMQQVYTFGSTGAVISSPNSVFSVAITNTKISMLQLGNEVSSWNANQMFVNSLVGTEIILGNHKIEKYTTGTVVRAL